MDATTRPPSDPVAPPDAESTHPDEPDGPGGLAFWLSAIAGAALVVFGIRGLLLNERGGATSAARWFIGGALALDLVIVPLAAAVGWAARRAVAAWAWPVVRAALFTTAILIVFAAPLVLDEGGVPSNPTIRPRDYSTGLAAAVGVTWAVAAIVLVAIRPRGRVSD